MPSVLLIKVNPVAILSVGNTQPEDSPEAGISRLRFVLKENIVVPFTVSAVALAKVDGIKNKWYFYFWFDKSNHYKCMRPIKIILSFFAGMAGMLAILFLIGYFGLLPTYKIFIVMSGSMEPSLKTGSLAFVIPFNKYAINDIVTFKQNGDKKNIVTHRIVLSQFIKNTDIFYTQGDANKTLDTGVLNQKDIIGKVVYSIPYLGYFVNFLKEPKGFILFVIVPITIIIYEELKTLKHESVMQFKKIKRKINEETKNQNSGFPKIAVIMPLIAMAFALTAVSGSFFKDRETSTGNVLSAGVWITPTITPALITDTPTPTPTPTLTPTPTMFIAQLRDVVINELMWSGSVGNSDDEWIELKNMNNFPINLSGWQLTGLEGTNNIETLMVAIPAGKTIPANGYFLISHFSKANSAINIDPDLIDSSIMLKNTALQIKLYKDIWTNSANLIDIAGNSETPLAGTNLPLKQSMERKDPPGDGTLSGNWKTCTDPACNDVTYWKTEGNNYGTPKSPNL